MMRIRCSLVIMFLVVSATYAESFNDNLLKYAKEGDLDQVISCIHNGADVDITDEDGNTPLLLAAENGHDLIVGMLLKQGANINHLNDDNETALYLACKNGHEIIVDILLDNGARLYDEKYPILMCSISNTYRYHGVEIGKAYCSIAEKLLINGANPNNTTKNGETPLMEASRECSIPLMEILLKYGAKVNAINDQKNCSAMMLACENGCIIGVKCLIDNGANINMKYRDRLTKDDIQWIYEEYGKRIESTKEITVLMKCAEFGMLEIIEILIENNVNKNEVDSNGNSTLHYACEVTNEWGAKNYAKREDVEEKCRIIEMMVKHGENVNIKNNDGNTPLMYSIIDWKNPLIEETLIKLGTDLSIRNNEGKTALMLAKEEGYEELIKLLSR